MEQSRIRVLDSAVIDHIAAGEVVERPASVVKELVENAFDAGAQTVQVDLEGGGLSGITVTDDGMGMSVDDARLCIMRHATSKLRQTQDLFCIKTLGFRGEALSSVASVSRMRITTRPKNASLGYRVEVHGGQVVAEGVTGCPRGTSIQVQELFFNTPARRKFMRAPATEQAHVADAGLRVALGMRRGGMVVTAGTRRLVDIPDDAVGQARIVSALGTRVSTLFPLAASQDGVDISGFVSAPNIDRADTKGLWLFVNGRFVRDRMLQRALLESYRDLHPGRYPTAIIYIDVAPEAVDVNVHPQKLEVRFADAQQVFRALTNALHNALLGAPAPIVTGSRVEAAIHRFQARPAVAWSAPPRQHRPVAEATALVWDDELPNVDAEKTVAAVSIPAHLPGQMPAADGFFSRLQLREQLTSLWLGRSPDGLWLLDADAAARRAAALSLRTQLAAQRIEVHTLLFPVRVEVSRAFRSRLVNEWEDVARLGFEIEPVGPDNFVIKAVPRALLDVEPQRLVSTCLAHLWTHQAAEIEVFEQCCRDVVAPQSMHSDEARQMLHILDVQGLSPEHPTTREFLRPLKAVDLQGLFNTTAA